MIDGILIDECRPPGLVAVAKGRGPAATHVTFIGQAGVSDWNVMPLLRARDFVFVTNNARDFLPLLGRRDVRNGLIIIIPQVGRTRQISLFNLALDAAERLDHLVNRVLEVHADGRVEMRDWPPGAAG